MSVEQLHLIIRLKKSKCNSYQLRFQSKVPKANVRYTGQIKQLIISDLQNEIIFFLQKKFVGNNVQRQ